MLSLAGHGVEVHGRSKYVLAPCRVVHYELDQIDVRWHLALRVGESDLPFLKEDITMRH